MTPDRERQIRKAWDRFGGNFNFGKRPRWVAPLYPEISVTCFDSSAPANAEPSAEVATFSIQHGWEDGFKASRIVCEDIVLATYRDLR